MAKWLMTITVLSLIGLAGCSAGTAASQSAQAPPSPSTSGATGPSTAAPAVPAVPAVPAALADPTPPPAPADARLLLPDPTARYIADVDHRLRIVNYAGQEIAAPDFHGEPVQLIIWSPRGDQLLAITGKATPECCDLFRDAHYWLVAVPHGAARELAGLPQEATLTWAADQQGLYVLDNWRRAASLDALGERIFRYDLATRQLTLLLDRHNRLTSVAELPGGDLLVQEYAGGGHAAYSRLAAGSQKLVTAAPFHMSLSPDRRWAVETNLYTVPELAIADVQTGKVTLYRPSPGWPAPGEKGTVRVADPLWAPDSRWLLYTVGGSDQVPPELRFFDRTQAEADRVLPGAEGVWLPGPTPQALVFRYADGSVQPWRYDVTTGQQSGPVGPKAPVGGGKPDDCPPLREIRVAAGGNTAAYLTCNDDTHSLSFIDLTDGLSSLTVPVDRDTWLLSLSADGKVAALAVRAAEGGTALRFVQLQGE